VIPVAAFIAFIGWAWAIVVIALVLVGYAAIRVWLDQK
jgi:hypothetical protein